MSINNEQMKPKSIRFFLNDLDGGHIHNLEELRNSNKIALQHLYELFQEGILERWLEVQDNKIELEKLRTLEKKQLDEEQLNKFTKILFPDFNLEDLELTIQCWKLSQKWEQEILTFSNKDKNRHQAINKYHSEFNILLNDIEKDAANMPALKAHIIKLSEDYLQLFLLNPLGIIECLQVLSPASILLMAANSTMRNTLMAIGLFDKVSDFILTEIHYSGHDDKDWVVGSVLHDSTLEHPVFLHRGHDYAKEKILEFESMDDINVKRFITLSDFLPSNDSEFPVISLLRSTNKDTDNSWEDIEPYNDKEFMIIKSPENNTRPYKQRDCELSAEQLKQLPIIKGIEFRNGSTSNTLIYMEV